jgi:uncharacterized protein YdcH (DUF465 family)
MDDLTIASSHLETAHELDRIADKIRKLKVRERKFKRILKQHNKLSRTIDTLAPKAPEVVRDKGWI